jgi:hypothetical protein
VVYAAGDALGVPVDWIRRAHVLRLLKAGDDVLAEDLMVQVRVCVCWCWDVCWCVCECVCVCVCVSGPSLLASYNQTHQHPPLQHTNTQQQVEQPQQLAGPVLQLLRGRLKGVLTDLRRGGGRGAQVGRWMWVGGRQ